MISTCSGLGPKGTVPAPAVLSVKEATEIAGNPIWGTQLPAEYVINGAKIQADPVESDQDFVEFAQAALAGCATPRS